MIGIYFGSQENGKGWMAKDSYLCQEDYVNIIPEYGSYPDFELINKISENKEGYFDFSKGMIDIGSELGQFSLNTPFSYYYMFDGNKQKCIMANANMLIRGKDEICEVHNTLLSDHFEFSVRDFNCSIFAISSGEKDIKLFIEKLVKPQCF